jgi:hypothetical protein
MVTDLVTSEYSPVLSSTSPYTRRTRGDDGARKPRHLARNHAEKWTPKNRFRPVLHDIHVGESLRFRMALRVFGELVADLVTFGHGDGNETVIRREGGHSHPCGLLCQHDGKAHVDGPRFPG